MKTNNVTVFLTDPTDLTPMGFSAALGFLMSGHKIKRCVWSNDSYLYLDGDRILKMYGGVPYPQMHVDDLAQSDWIVI